MSRKKCVFALKYNEIRRFDGMHNVQYLYVTVLEITTLICDVCTDIVHCTKRETPAYAYISVQYCVCNCEVLR